MTADRIAIIGTGLIGGSIGLGLGRRRPSTDVAGFDVDPEAATGALDRGAVGELAPTVEECVGRASVVVLAMPVDRMPAVCERVAASVAPGTVVTDVGSAKAGVVAAAEHTLGGAFVGGHPMAGSERHGIDAAVDDLFEDAWWILTPTATTSHAAYTTVAQLVVDLGAKPVAIDPNAHDSLVARLSHVPQLTASAIVHLAATAGDREALLGLAGPGFRDVTRIAASHPEMWVAILRANQSAVLGALEGLGTRLGEVAELIRAGRWDRLASFLEGARRARLDLFAKPALPRETVALVLTIPDRPGVLAEVTTAAGRLGANIEELNIIHSTEGGRGRLELLVAGHDRAVSLAGELEDLGYHVTVADLLE